MTFTDKNLTNRVTAGISWLDEKIPGWADKIDLDLLDLSNRQACILAQLGDSGDYGRTKTQLDISVNDAYLMGFDLPIGLHDASYQQLTEVWRREIRERPSTTAAFEVEVEMDSDDLAEMLDAAKSLEDENSPYTEAMFTFTGTHGEQVTVRIF